MKNLVLLLVVLVGFSSCEVINNNNNGPSFENHVNTNEGFLEVETLSIQDNQKTSGKTQSGSLSVTVNNESFNMTKSSTDFNYDSNGWDGTKGITLLQIYNSYSVSFEDSINATETDFNINVSVFVDTADNSIHGYSLNTHQRVSYINRISGNDDSTRAYSVAYDADSTTINATFFELDSLRQNFEMNLVGGDFTLVDISYILNDAPHGNVEGWVQESYGEVYRRGLPFSGLTGVDSHIKVDLEVIQ